MRRQAASIAVADAVIWCSTLLLAMVIAYVAGGAAIHRLPASASTLLSHVALPLAAAGALVVPGRMARPVCAGITAGVLLLALMR